MTPRLGQLWNEKRGTKRVVQIIAFGKNRRGFPNISVKNVDTGRVTTMVYSDINERFVFLRNEPFEVE